MNERCLIGNLRLSLDVFPDDAGCQEDKDGLLNAALSRVQKSLNSRLLLAKTEEHYLEVQDCAVSNDAGRCCLKDLEGLASNLVSLLTSENSFTRHSVGKTFVALFSYLHGSASLWVFLLGVLWNFSKGCFAGEDGDKCLKKGVRYSCLGTKHGGTRIAMHLFQILHNSFRKFKQEWASDLEGFAACSAAHISEVLVAFSTCFKCSIDNLVKSEPEVEDNLMLAALLRLLCSFIHSVQTHPKTVNIARIFHENYIMTSLGTFLESISQHCLSPHQRGCLSPFLRHKCLMLMFRLHDWFIKWPPLASTCLEILRSNMSSLCPLLFAEHTSPPDPLLLSPFAACLTQSQTQFLPVSSACQPEKHAVFLIFKLELFLIRTQSGSSSGNGSGGEQGLQWMSKWLLSQMILPEQHSSSSGTAEIANHLALSFLQIFLDEDTSLLEILLLLQDCAISDLFRGSSIHDSSLKSQKLLVEIFKPIRLFAVFISLISYDHSIMVDFLIAKDTSILCLQYLLRSMRLVRNTWPELLSLSADTSTSTRLGLTESYHQVSNQDDALACEKVIDINRVGTCLVKLRRAIEKLYKKHAFPYNPSPLLKQLEFFEHSWADISS